jgi:peptide/nickel transport system substrate-binding protein
LNPTRIESAETNDQEGKSAMIKSKIPLIVIGVWILTTGAVYAQQQRVLRVCQALTAPGTLDPQLNFNIEVEDITGQICEHLVDRDPDGKLIPSLATSWQLINENTWQFKLRRGVTFHNGEEFDAKAVKFSIERIIDPNGKSPQKYWYASISQAEIIDDYTINIITKGIDVLLPAKLGSYLGSIVPMQYLTEAGDAEFGRHPVGTGPFRFLSRGREKEVILIPNETYWGKIPKIDRLVFHFIPDPQKQIEMLINGNLDIVSNIPPRSASRLKQSPSTNLVKKATVQYSSSRMNTIKGGPLSDPRVRQSINYAVDVDKLIKYVFNGNGKRLATTIMPEEFGFNPSLKPYPYDLQLAKELLKKAGYADGITLNFIVFNDLEELGKAIEKELSRANIKLKTRLISREDFTRESTNKTLDYDLTLGNPVNPFIDAGFQLNLMFSSKSPFSVYRNETVDQLLAEAARTTDEPARKLILMKIQEIIHSEATNLFLFQIIKAYGLQRGVSGFIPYADGILRLNQVSIKK